MFNEPETKILFAIYNLYKTDKISEEQRGELKDMLISKDPQLTRIRDEANLEQKLLSIVDKADTSSTVSYKMCRPSKLIINNRFLKDISSVINHEQAFKKQKKQ